MYNLIIGCSEGLVPAGRMELAPEVVALLGMTDAQGNMRLDNLQTLPTLLAPEIDSGWMEKPPPQIARFGRVMNLRPGNRTYHGQEWKFTFVANDISPVPLKTIEALAGPLDIDTRGYGDLGHTAWSVKHPDLYEVLLAAQVNPIYSPTPQDVPLDTGLRALHPLVWKAAEPLWKDGHTRDAVSAAGRELAEYVKTLTNRRDVVDTALWQQAFSKDAPEAGKVRLRWPGDPTDQEVKGMNEGLARFAPGVQMTGRNPAVHGTEVMSEQDTLERLAVFSLLARWVDHCERVEADPAQEDRA